jgi:hypothetical protein
MSRIGDVDEETVPVLPHLRGKRLGNGANPFFRVLCAMKKCQYIGGIRVSDWQAYEEFVAQPLFVAA